MPAERPNILLVYADQHRWDCTEVNGHPLLRTAALARLATEGVNFTHAFTPIPLCVPARCSLLTGAWPATHRCLMNEGTEGYRPMDPTLPTLGPLLAGAGYSLAHIGKWQVDPKRTPLDFGFDRYVPESAYRAWRKAAGLPPPPRSNGWFGQVDPHIRPEQSALGWGADQVIGLLREAATARRPFFVRWNPSEPHLPNVPPEPFASMVRPEDVRPWGSFFDPLDGKPFIQAQQRRTWKIDRWTWADWAPIVARYLGQIALLDAQLARVLAALGELGQADNTAVIYTADHGDLCGSHGMIDKHFVMYDDVVRVPLLIRWPGRAAAGRRCDGFVCNALDVAATICRLAGADPPAAFAGQDLWPLAEGTADSKFPDIFASYHGNQFGLYSQRMVRGRDSDHKYVWNATAEDELYDLAGDPWELNNLAGRPEHRDTLARFRRRLVEWMASTADPLLNGWTREQLLGGLKP